MELRMITDLATVAPKELLFNYDELKEFLTDALRDYKALVVTEDGITDAKAKRAKLNKLAENINAYRINVKKQLMAQYDEDFKPKCDELVAMTKEASDSISTQIKAFEQAEAEAKVASLREYYDSVVDDEIREYLPWDVLYNQKWTNKTCSAEYAKAEIYARISTVKSDLDAIRQMGGEDTAYLLGYYQETLDLSAVIKKQTDLKTRRQRIQQQVREEEERRKAAEQGEELMSAIKQAAAESVASILENEAVVTIDFRVTCTKGQLAALGRWLKDNGIEYGRVPNGN